MEMNTSSGVIGIIPVFSVIVLAVGLMNHVLVIPPLLQEAKRDAWLGVLSVILPYLLWVSMLYYIMRNTNQQPIMSWLKEHYGKALSWGARIFFIIYLSFISAITLKETIVWTHVSYLPRTPKIVLSLSMVLVCIYAVHVGIRAITIAAGILLPLVIIFGDFVMSANLPAKDYTLMTPILENGIAPVLRSDIYIGGGLVELVIILLLQHQLKSRVRLWSLWLLGFFLVGLVFGPVTGAIAEFGPFEAAKLRYPAYEEWRLVKIGDYIHHVDFLSIYQWLSGAVIRISIALYLLVDMLEIQQKKHRRMWIYFLGFVLVIIVALPISDMHYLLFLKQIYFPASLSLVLLLSLGLLVLVFLATYKREKHNGSSKEV
jgi:spore germination protein KB